jgi:hypothetical protein
VKNHLQRCYLIFVFVLIAACAIPQSGVAAEGPFVTVSLPMGVSIELPRNWQVISENTRITVDAYVASIIPEDYDSELQFAAVLYNEREETIGILNARYFQDSVTQSEVRKLGEKDVKLADKKIRAVIEGVSKKANIRIVEWKGTSKRVINGLETLMTEYRRASIVGAEPFRVRHVRVLNAKNSFTLTISYRVDAEIALGPISDRMISSLRQTKPRAGYPRSSSYAMKRLASSQCFIAALRLKPHPRLRSREQVRGPAMLKKSFRQSLYTEVGIALGPVCGVCTRPYR